MIAWVFRLLMIRNGELGCCGRRTAFRRRPDDGGAPAAHARRRRAGVLAVPLDDPAQSLAEVPMAGTLHVSHTGPDPWGSPEAM